MITTPSAGGRPAPVAAPIHQIAEEAAARRAQILAAQTPETEQAVETNATGAETPHAIAAVPLTEAPLRYIADREQAMRDKMTEDAAKAAQPLASELAASEDGERKVEPLDRLPPPATEVAAKGHLSRTDARAEIYEAEARMRVLERAAAGYAAGRSAFG